MSDVPAAPGVTWLDFKLVTMPHMVLVTNEAAFLAACEGLDAKYHDRAQWIPDDGYACVHKYFGAAGGYTAIVAVNAERLKAEDPLEAVACIVHEAVHVFQGWCGWTGEGAPSKEFEAYAIQNISFALLTSYRDQTQGPPA